MVLARSDIRGCCCPAETHHLPSGKAFALVCEALDSNPEPHGALSRAGSKRFHLPTPLGVVQQNKSFEKIAGKPRPFPDELVTRQPLKWVGPLEFAGEEAKLCWKVEPLVPQGLTPETPTPGSPTRIRIRVQTLLWWQVCWLCSHHDLPETNQ